MPLSFIPIHFVGLPTAGALAMVPAEAPAPFVRAELVVRKVAPPKTVTVEVNVAAPAEESVNRTMLFVPSVSELACVFINSRYDGFVEWSEE